MKKSIVWVLVLFPVFVFAQKQDEGQKLIDKFFQHYLTNGPDDAMMYALQTNKWLAADSDDDSGYSPFRKLGKITSHMGKYVGIEEISSKMVGSRVKVVNYLVYYEHQPVLFTFELYKHNDDWEFADVQYNRKPEKALASGTLNF